MAIYVMREISTGLVKVGFSDNPAQRQVYLKATRREPFEMVCVFEGDLCEEQALHSTLAPWRAEVEGSGKREMYRAEPEFWSQLYLTMHRLWARQCQSATQDTRHIGRMTARELLSALGFQHDVAAALSARVGKPCSADMVGAWGRRNRIPSWWFAHIEALAAERGLSITAAHLSQSVSAA